MTAGELQWQCLGRKLIHCHSRYRPHNHECGPDDHMIVESRKVRGDDDDETAWTIPCCVLELLSPLSSFSCVSGVVLNGFIYVCLSVCLCPCLSECMYICMYVCTHVCMYVSIYLSACLSVYPPKHSRLSHLYKSNKVDSYSSSWWKPGKCALMMWGRGQRKRKSKQNIRCVCNRWIEGWQKYWGNGCECM